MLQHLGLDKSFISFITKVFLWHLSPIMCFFNLFFIGNVQIEKLNYMLCFVSLDKSFNLSNCLLSVFKKFCDFFFQLKMKAEMHYSESDCPLTAPDSFPMEDELHFEIEMLDFFKVKARKSSNFYIEYIEFHPFLLFLLVFSLSFYYPCILEA